MSWIKIVERILLTIPVMFGITLIVFLFMRFTPGDPVDLMMGSDGNVSESEIAALKEQYNLDASIPVQLYDYFTGILTGDFGESFTKSKPVLDLIVETLPATIELALMAVLFSVLIGIPIGVYSAVKQNSLIDRLSMGGSFFGISVPPFWLGIVLIFIFSVHLGWTPVKGRVDFGIEIQRITGLNLVDSFITGNWSAFKSSFMHLVLPAITLGAATSSVIARVTRSTMLEVLRADYVTLARAKGLKESHVIIKHALRNGLIPTVTVIGLEIGILLGGNMIVETVFGWPGLGRLAVEAIFSRDYPLVQGVVMFYAFTFVMANLLVDTLYTYLNPKIGM
ncbi:ABC transporter permease [Paenisporosarcina sp. TG-14]|uniref:ABC transporter permease n=1 Tax=Paenisporosarcina sp. TG-14 TaxID=1231057 RepID=UPI0002F9F1BB|nr:ABC transporter permease [Paenisporosarcina sp. TG-14]